MKMLLMADIHLEHDDSQKGEDASPREVKSGFILDKIEELVSFHRPNALVILGDLFDQHGIVGSRVASRAIDLLVGIQSKYGSKVILITGNHDQPDFEESSFGKSSISLLFKHRESDGVFVVDESARCIDVGQDANGRRVVVAGMPYRRSETAFTATCLVPFEQSIAGIHASHPDAIIVPCWHAGLPLNSRDWKEGASEGESKAFGGDEPENPWAVFAHPVMKPIFAAAHNGRVFLGHYHRPATEVSRDNKHFFQYIGSLATRTRAESGEQKQALLWEDGVLLALPTGLNFHIADTIEVVEKHVQDMIVLLGERVRPLLQVRVRLPKNATSEDYTQAKIRAARLGVNAPDIDDLPTQRVTFADALIAQYQETGDRVTLEREVAMEAAKQQSFSAEDISMLTRVLDLVS